MTREEIRRWLFANIGKGMSQKLHSKENKNILDSIFSLTRNLNSKHTLLTRIFWILNGLKDFPKCEYCDKPMRDKNVRCLTRGYPRFCSLKCSGLSDAENYRGIPNVERLRISAEKHNNRGNAIVRKCGNIVLLRCGLKVEGIERINYNHKIHHLVYKMENLTNGHYYIGHHSTIDPLDEYMGSGVAITHAIAKYGIKNFKKVILFDYGTLEESCERERVLVTKEISSERCSECYNLKQGGYGGCDSEAGRKAAETRKLHGYKVTEATKHKISLSNKGVPKSESHRISLSKHHRANRWYTIKFETGREERYYGTLPQICKSFNIPKNIELRRNSIKGKFYYGIRIGELENHELVQQMGYSKKERILKDPITGEMVSWFTLRRRKSLPAYKGLGKIWNYLTDK